MRAKQKNLLALAGLLIVALGVIISLRSREEPNTPRSERLAPSESEGRLLGIPERSPTAFRQALVFIDLLDKRPVGELAARLSTASRTSEFVTDRNGAIDLERPEDTAGGVRITMLDAAWHLARDEFPLSAEPITVHVYRDLQLDGLVRVLEDDELHDLTKVKVSFEVVGEDPQYEPRVPRLAWMRRHHVSVNGSLPHPDRAGVFKGIVPRLRGLVVHARMPGRYAESVAVATDAKADRARVVIELRNGIRLQGQLTDENGNPPATGSTIVVYITVRGDPKELTQGEASRLAGGAGAVCGLAYRSSQKDNEAIATFVYAARTDESGRYSLIVKQQGDAVVRANVPGHSPATATPGWLSDQKEGLDLLAKRVSARSTVLVLVDGQPAKNARVELVELVRRGPQMTATIQADEKGRIPAAWLERGRSYLVSTGGVNKEFVEWHGQSRIDITPLPKKGFQLLPKGWW